MLEQFARKHWGEQKQQEVWRVLTFMYTCQGPVEARVLDLARQVKDLLNSPDVALGQPVRMLAIGDRDYRTDASRSRELRAHATRAKSSAYQLDLALRLWNSNEIENYLLDRTALLGALGRQADEKGVAPQWSNHQDAFVDELDSLLAGQRRLGAAGRGHTHSERRSETRAEHRPRPSGRVPEPGLAGADPVVRCEAGHQPPESLAPGAGTCAANRGGRNYRCHGCRPRRRAEDTAGTATDRQFASLPANRTFPERELMQPPGQAAPSPEQGHRGRLPRGGCHQAKTPRADRRGRALAAAAGIR